MSTSIQSLIDSGTKLWLDSIDPDLVRKNIELGATGATSNPIIVSDLIQSGRFDERISTLLDQHESDEDVAWAITDELVASTQSQFLEHFQRSQGNDGYVSFELDPLLEDPQSQLGRTRRAEQYVQLGLRWNEGQVNRMIKVPATPAGIDALEELVAGGVSVNVTLVFTMEQYRQARDAVWRGAQRRLSLDQFKSVYSIFVSRIDVYSQKHCPQLGPQSQGSVGIVNAKRIWHDNREFWADKQLPLDQEIIFASTGTKKPEDEPCKYVMALAGSDIQTNPPATNDAVAASNYTFSRTVDQLPSSDVLQEIDQVVNFDHLYKTLMKEGIAKFCEPQKVLLEQIRKKRRSLAQT